MVSKERVVKTSPLHGAEILSKIGGRHVFAQYDPVERRQEALLLVDRGKSAFAEPIGWSNKRFCIWERLMTASESSGSGQLRFSTKTQGQWSNLNSLPQNVGCSQQRQTG